MNAGRNEDRLKLTINGIMNLKKGWRKNQTKRNYLHPIIGLDATKIGAGLFMKPV